MNSHLPQSEWSNPNFWPEDTERMSTTELLECFEDWHNYADLPLEIVYDAQDALDVVTIAAEITEDFRIVYSGGNFWMNMQRDPGLPGNLIMTLPSLDEATSKRIHEYVKSVWGKTCTDPYSAKHPVRDYGLTDIYIFEGHTHRSDKYGRRGKHNTSGRNRPQERRVTS